MPILNTGDFNRINFHSKYISCPFDIQVITSTCDFFTDQPFLQTSKLLLLLKKKCLAKLKKVKVKLICNINYCILFNFSNYSYLYYLSIKYKENI